jgi:hypothetical protein
MYVYIYVYIYSLNPLITSYNWNRTSKDEKPGRNGRCKENPYIYFKKQTLYMWALTYDGY